MTDKDTLWRFDQEGLGTSKTPMSELKVLQESGKRVSCWTNTSDLSTSQLLLVPLHHLTLNTCFKKHRAPNIIFLFTLKYWFKDAE